MRWELFCTVVDNYGDIGFCWRLARQLSEEHQVSIRLWVDNLERLASFCPEISTTATQQFVGPIEIRRWTNDPQEFDPADVVIEAFACQLPPAYIAAMADRSPQPIWINLEYLSAEPWVEGCHRLASPRSNGLPAKTFFFPGFTSQTGGLLRERHLLDDRRQFDRSDQKRFWIELGLSEIASAREAISDSEQLDDLVISLFCYPNPALHELLTCLSESGKSVHLIATAGHATEQIGQWFGEEFGPGRRLQRRSLTAHAVPFLSQAQYDRLLWSCDLNFVRGEDSFVRAQWAQQPFVWQIYPQSENAHQAKLDAFLSRYLCGLEQGESVRRMWLAWNGVGDLTSGWEEFTAILPVLKQHGKEWSMELDQAGNLADNLVRFVCAHSL